MNIHRLLLISFLMLGITTLMGQYINPPQQLEPGYPYFDTKVFSTFEDSTGDPIARIYLQIPNNALTFVKQDSGYRADIQIEVVLSEKENDYVFNRTLSKQVFVPDFESTNAPDINNIFYSDIPVTPGDYKATVLVLDKNSNKQVQHKTTFKVNQPSKRDHRFLLSGILFSDNFGVDTEGNVVEYQPELTNNFASQGKYIMAHFNTFTFEPTDTLLIEYFVRDDRGVVVQHNQYVSSSSEPLVKHFIRLNRYLFSRHQYSFEVIASINGIKQSSQDYFNFYWKYVPNSVEDLNQALQQLRYIADMDSIKFYLKAPYTERKAYFQRFWKKQDPNPDTPENELMDEYYRRVNFANKNFSITGLDGWLTDRGRIYIKFGHPDDIERHPFEAGSYPYEIWRYYNNRKTFLFIDRTGFGDYVLHPSY
ncbi:MAG: GWxTD domain-containing protein, partial [Methanobacteriota archaeon]